jgi:transposase
MRATAKTYTDEFRSDAVALCRRGDRSLVEVARDIGVNHWTLRGWYRADEMKRSKKKKTTRLVSVTPPADETAEEKIKRLEREVVRLQRKTEQLEMDREILKKAAAFFAKESE